MKKSLKGILTAGALALTLGLTSCGSVSQGYADKINNAAKSESKDDDYTYEKVLKDLGEPALNLTATLLGVTSGACTWYKGCKTQEEANQKIKDGKDVDYIIVTFVANYATLAEYGTTEGK